MATLDTLIAAIDAEPDDEERYLVLADALIAAGDPRGDLIVLQHRRAAAPRDPEALRAEAGQIPSAWGELAPWQTGFWGVRWRLGFLDVLKIDSMMDGDVATLLDTLSTAPVARWLRELHVGMRGRKFVGDPGRLCTLANLRGLRLVDGGGLGDANLEAFARMPRLERLALGHCKISGAAIAGLRPAALRELRLLELEDFGDAHLAATAACDWLRTLTIHGTDITDAGPARMGDAVRELGLVYCPQITSDVMRAIGARPLTSLELHGHEPFAGSELAQLSKTLVRVEVDGVTDVAYALRALAEHGSLREAELLGGDFGDRAEVEAATLAAFLALPELRRVDVRSLGPLTGGAVWRSSVEDLTLGLGVAPPNIGVQIASLPLTALDLSALPPKLNAWVGDEVVAPLGALRGLESLVLRRSPITDAGLAHLSVLRLATLELTECKRITARGLAAFAEMPLRSLDLRWCAGVDSIAALGSQDRLVELDLRGTSITDTDLIWCATMPSLREFRLARTAITDAGLAALLPAAATLEYLDLQDCEITDAAISTLRQLRRLERLSLKNTKVHVAATDELARELPACRISR